MSACFGSFMHDRPVLHSCLLSTHLGISWHSLIFLCQPSSGRLIRQRLVCPAASDNLDKTWVSDVSSLQARPAPTPISRAPAVINVVGKNYQCIQLEVVASPRRREVGLRVPSPAVSSSLIRHESSSVTTRTTAVNSIFFSFWWLMPSRTCTLEKKA